MTNLVDDLMQTVVDRLENPLCTIELAYYDSISEAEIEEFKALLAEKHYIFSDGRKNGWQKIWVKKNSQKAVGREVAV